MKKTIIIVATIAVIAIGFCAAVLFVDHTATKPHEYNKMTEIGNMRNSGIVVEAADGTGFYLDIAEHGIRKLDEKTAILAPGDVYGMFLCDKEWIYYNNRDDGYLSRVSFDTGESEVVARQQFFELVEMDGELYGVSALSKRLCKIEEDPVSGEMLLDYLTSPNTEVDTLTVFDHTLYFRGDDALLRLHENKIETVITGINIECDSLYIMDETLYYIDNQKESLYKMDKSGVVEELTPGYRPLCLNVWGHSLTFIAFDNLTYRTYMYDPGTGMVTKYADRGYNGLCIANDHIYSYRITYDGNSIRDVKTGHVLSERKD